MPTYDKPWHDHPSMTKSTSPILSKSYAPSNVIFLSKAR